MLKDFKPALRFVAIFVSCYLVGNGIYGLYIKSTNPQPDIFTRIVSNQTAMVLNFFDEPVYTFNQLKQPLVSISKSGKVLLAVFEGCNGINILVVFVAFIAAYKSFNKSNKQIIWFVPLGIFVIWCANIMRLFVLYFVAAYYKHYYYFAHKYLFTLFLYAIVLLLWWWWIKLTETPDAAHHER
jgi:exosortase family protein XrtF